MKLTPMRGSSVACNDLDRLFDTFFTAPAATTRLTWGPGIDVVEDKDTYRLLAELPGLKKEDVKVELNENVLTVSGEKKIERSAEGNQWHRVERREGRFERSFTLAKPIQADKISAKFADGVLTVVVPKAEEAKPREIQIDY